jgi:uncharacterized protein (TIGR02996 family)
MSLRTFVYSDAKSNKFWNIELTGKSFTVTFGRVGSKGQTKTKKFKTEAAAQKEYDKLIKEKLKKGYKETTATEEEAAPSEPILEGRAAELARTLEEALAENPDEVATHAAYADLLSDSGDPRGEFIQVQLALEDEKLKPAERKKLQKREKALLKKHIREWLGDLAGPLLDGPEVAGESTTEFSFHRGWLDSLSLRYRISMRLTRALAQAPQTGLLRRLEVHHDPYLEASETEGENEYGDETYVPQKSDAIPEEGQENPVLFPLTRSGYLGNVRILQLGDPSEGNDEEGYYNCHFAGYAAAGLVKVMPKLEELYLLTHHADTEQIFSLPTLEHLRILQVDHNRRYPLARLAKNAALGNLTHLFCHPHVFEGYYEDDAGEGSYISLEDLRALARSKHLSSLTHLRLRLTAFGDKGIREIIDSGLLARLKVLDLRAGRVTDAGAQLLAEQPETTNLELLDLSINNMTNAGIYALQATGVKLRAERQWGSANPEEWLFTSGDIE